MKQPAIISLFDYTGHMVHPWVERGYQAFIFDIQHPAGYNPQPGNSGVTRVRCDLSNWLELRIHLRNIAREYDVQFLCGFPPCTDLAVSGAKHFATKQAANPAYRDEAMDMVHIVHRAGEYLGVPGFLENPVSVISSEWRKPDYTFTPADYGGYIPEHAAEHPEFPEIIPPRDAYTKRTCLWTWGGFRMPEKRPVTCDKVFHGWAKLGGKSLRTKNIRSATPRGFAEAVAQANADPCAWMGNNMRSLFGL